ncbi:MAG: hypothetical protein HYZ72_20530 [Deltaproteobacteria bacterium]|nr:hypothetical protein [Deltaproteobacteria bacterium]
MHLYEDLYAVGRSARLRARIDTHERVLNVQNLRVGIEARRGDGTFGELIPNVKAITDPGSVVARGHIATVEIGSEVKIIAKAMIKQIDRVIGDLNKQVQEFRKGGGRPICVGIVGINHADFYTSYEGDRSYPTDGRKYKHPVQEAREAETRLRAQTRPSFDHFLIIPFRATNTEPYPFEWVNLTSTEREYGAILTRICREYEARFR